MKNVFRIVCYLACFIPLTIHAQTQGLLTVESFKLDNGLTILLNQDTTASRVFGAMVVKAGGIHESPDATGMAHYLEHLLFKGTDVLGTTDYAKEKVHLAKIKDLYDDLSATTSGSTRTQIQNAINKESILAAQYVVPNEMTQLLNSIGSTDIGGYTEYDYTIFHNYFPSHEINRWLDIYATRFQNPVFRSFQSELEVVYEEKNRWTDDFTNAIFDQIEELVYPNVPYGQWTLIGHTGHLKNPSISRVQEYYDKYYTADRMALVLTGNFDPRPVKKMVADKFAGLRRGSDLVYEAPKVKRPSSITKKEIAVSPFAMEILGFQTARRDHEDRIILDVCEYLLSNKHDTGYLDEIDRTGSTRLIGGESTVYNLAGSYIIFFAPTKSAGSMEQMEGMVFKALDKLKNGNFTKDQLQAAKFNLSKDFQRQLEQLQSRGDLMGQVFSADMSWGSFMRYPELMAKVSHEDVQSIAKKYFGDNYAKLISKKGNPKKDRLKKPGYKSVETTPEGRSVYAAKFKGLEVGVPARKFVRLKSDAMRSVMDGGHHIIHVNNAVNDLFDLKFMFKTGTLHNPTTRDAVNLMNYVGAGEYDAQRLKERFSILGCTIELTAERNYTVIRLEGPEENLEACLELTGQLLKSPSHLDQAKKQLEAKYEGDRGLERGDPSLLGFALIRYAALGDSSEYTSRNSINRVREFSAGALITHFQEIVEKYEADILFTGKTTSDELAAMINASMNLATNPIKNELIYVDGKRVSRNTIYLVDDHKARQSQVFFYVRGAQFEHSELPKSQAYTKYFAAPFTGVTFSEIREKRALAYVTGGQYVAPLIPNRSGKLIMAIGCQSDKTIESIEVMADLIQNLPLQPEKIQDLRAGLQKEAEAAYPDFRDLAETIFELEEQGHKKDPNHYAIEEFADLDMSDILSFHERHIKNKPFVITIYGNKKRLDMNKLNAMGEVVEIELKDFITF